ncbi:MAG: ABC transporter permease [Gemmatimonadaceae bacterium]
MVRFLLRRVLQGIAIILTVATLTFALIHAAPGEPFGALLEDPRFSLEMRDQLRARYGLDRPLSEQYVRYIAKMARGDLDISLSRQRPVRTILAEALPRTLLLMTAAIGVGFALGIALGALQAAREGSLLDRIFVRITVTLAAVPDFWLALALMLVFAVKLRWFPVTGMVDDAMHPYLSPLGKLRDIARHLVLPASSLALLVTAVVARHQRAAVLEVLPEDYVRTARAKGLSERVIVMRHALRNALLPTITLFGLALPSLVGGAVFIESVFSWPGMGRTAIDALSARDYPLVLGTVLVGSVFVVVGSIVTDLLYVAAEPRLRRA